MATKKKKAPTPRSDPAALWAKATEKAVQESMTASINKVVGPAATNIIAKKCKTIAESLVKDELKVVEKDLQKAIKAKLVELKTQEIKKIIKGMKVEIKVSLPNIYRRRRQGRYY